MTKESIKIINDFIRTLNSNNKQNIFKYLGLFKRLTEHSPGPLTLEFFMNLIRKESSFTKFYLLGKKMQELFKILNIKLYLYQKKSPGKKKIQYDYETLYFLDTFKDMPNLYFWELTKLYEQWMNKYDSEPAKESGLSEYESNYSVGVSASYVTKLRGIKNKRALLIFLRIKSEPCIPQIITVLNEIEQLANKADIETKKHLINEMIEIFSLFDNLASTYPDPLVTKTQNGLHTLRLKLNSINSITTLPVEWDIIDPILPKQTTPLISKQHPDKKPTPPIQIRSNIIHFTPFIVQPTISDWLKHCYTFWIHQNFWSSTSRDLSTRSTNALGPLELPFPVFPAQAGIHPEPSTVPTSGMVPRLRGDDNLGNPARAKLATSSDLENGTRPRRTTTQPLLLTYIPNEKPLQPSIQEFSALPKLPFPVFTAQAKIHPEPSTVPTSGMDPSLRGDDNLGNTARAKLATSSDLENGTRPRRTTTQPLLLTYIPDEKPLQPSIQEFSAPLELPFHVFPAQAGIHPESSTTPTSGMDPRLRRDDNRGIQDSGTTTGIVNTVPVDVTQPANLPQLHLKANTTDEKKELLYQIVQKLKNNIRNQKDRLTTRNSTWKIGLFDKINIRQDPQQSIQSLIEEVRGVCAKRRNAFHFWAKPESVSEFESLLDQYKDKLMPSKR